MSGKLILILLSAALASGAPGQRGTYDPAFERVPFNQWLKEPPSTHFHWKAHVSRAELSFHQRLIAPIEVVMDGADLQTRRGNGRIVFLIQITASDGTVYQHHNSIELNKLDENIKAANLEMSQRAFFMPGDYQLAAAVFDTATKEHSAIQGQFRVASPNVGFLLEAWRDLPAVEFIEQTESPDSWYLPTIQGRLRWAASIDSPSRLNVILNVAPAVAHPGSRSAPSSGFEALLPLLKALTQTGSPSVSQTVKLLDLGRRRAVYTESDGKELDWSRLKPSLGEANTASIDIHSLSERHQDAQFFVSELRSLLRASEKPSVLVVLTTPVAFESGEDLEPISLEALPPVRVIYIRYHATALEIPPFPPEFGGRGRRGRMGDDPMMRNQLARGVVDQLESTLKPLHPKVFDVETPEQMTKALREVRNVLAGQK